MNIKKGDKVKVITGAYKGTIGEVKAVFPKEDRVIVEGVNMVKKHLKPTQANPEGGIVEKEAKIHVSNVMLYDEKAKVASRITTKVEVVDGKKVTVYDEVEKTIKKDMPSRLHARREMLKVLYPVTEVPTAQAGRKKNTKDVDMADKMFNEIAPKYADRNGGYTRIIKIGPRKGDAAMEVVLELV